MPSSVRTIHSSNELLEQIKLSNKMKPYDFVYISYGSKVNENYVQIGNSTIMTNSHLQVIPNFLQGRSENTKILIISIDNYLNDDNKTIHKIQSHIEPNMDVLLFNNAITSIEEITICLVQYFIEIEFNPKNLMFCNFIRFITPNKIECKIEEDVPNIIYNIICQVSVYKYMECFYQWYGYNIYTYNLVFKYLLHEPICVMYNRLLNIFASRFDKKTLVNDDFAELIELYNSNPKSPLKTFMNSSIDISNYWKNANNIKETIYELALNTHLEEAILFPF